MQQLPALSLSLLAAAHLGLGHAERALRCLDEAGGPEQRELALMDWNWQMPLGYCASEIWLACGDRDRARQEAMAGLLPALDDYGVHLIGRYGAWTYSYMERAMLDGLEGAQRLLAPTGHAAQPV